MSRQPEEAQFLAGYRENIVGLVLRHILHQGHRAVGPALTGKLPRADGDLAVGRLSGLFHVNRRVKQHEDSRFLVILEHIIPQDRHACDTDSGSNAQPLERQTGREQHDNRDHQVLNRHAGVTDESTTAPIITSVCRPTETSPRHSVI